MVSWNFFKCKLTPFSFQSGIRLSNASVSIQAPDKVCPPKIGSYKNTFNI